jgi:tRNA pseudouridine55 synthase
LGCTSPTDDIEGDIRELVDVPVPSLEEIERACAGFVGTIEPRPPAFSAIKVGGRRAYELARRGTAVELKRRPVRIHELRVVEFSYPRLVLEIRCSAGTYVRSLGRDLAESLGTGAVMSELVRTQIGPFRVEDAIDPRQPSTIELETAILSPLAAVPDLPRFTLTEAQVHEVSYGAFVDRRELAEPTAAQPLAIALDTRGDMVAILKRRDDGLLAPYINFIGKS